MEAVTNADKSLDFFIEPLHLGQVFKVDIDNYFGLDYIKRFHKSQRKTQDKMDTMYIVILIRQSTSNQLVGVHMERQQAVALLKEIVTHDLAQPTAVYVREIVGKFELVMKDDCKPPLQKFIAEKGLKWCIREDMGVCIIFKP